MQTVPIREAEAAQRLGISKDTLVRLRKARQGPAYIRAGRRLIVYSPADLEAWLSRRRVEFPQEASHVTA